MYKTKQRSVHMAGNSYALYLPMKWAKKIELDKIPLVNIHEDATGDLILSPSRKVKETVLERETTMKYYEEWFIHSFIINSYLLGYDKFTIHFEKPLLKKQIMYHRKDIEELGLTVDVVEFTPNKAVFYCAETFIPAKTLLKNLFTNLLNLVRSAEQSDLTFVKSNLRSISKLRWTIGRFFMHVLSNPAILVDSELNLFDCFFLRSMAINAKTLAYLLSGNNSYVRLEFKKLNKNDIENFKKIIEIAMLLVDNLNQDLLWKYNTTLNEIKNKILFDYAQQLEQLFIAWYLRK